MIIALTGHRPERLRGQEETVSKWIEYSLAAANKIDKVTRCISGMAQGADQIFAIKALEMGFPLECAYPYKRTNFHPQEEYINEAAVAVNFISGPYARECYFIRDKYLVDNCDYLFAVWDGDKEGGTYDTIQYAQKVGKPIHYIPAAVLKFGVDEDKIDRLKDYAERF